MWLLAPVWLSAGVLVEAAVRFLPATDEESEAWMLMMVVFMSARPASL